MNSRTSKVLGGAVILFVIGVLIISSITTPQSATAQSGLGADIAGTYLQGDAQGIMQISSDGGILFVLAEQFLGGAGDQLFTDSIGSWVESGNRTITATLANLNYTVDDGSFTGVALVNYAVVFDTDFENASVTCEGRIYDSSVNPLEDPDATPDVEFDCGVVTFQRIPIEAAQYTLLAS